MLSLPCNIDYEFEIDATRKATTTDDDEAATGITSISAWISATKGGAAIHANLSKSLTERTAEAGAGQGRSAMVERTLSRTLFQGKRFSGQRRWLWDRLLSP